MGASIFFSLGAYLVRDSVGSRPVGLERTSCSRPRRVAFDLPRSYCEVLCRPIPYEAEILAVWALAVSASTHLPAVIPERRVRA